MSFGGQAFSGVQPIKFFPFINPSQALPVPFGAIGANLQVGAGPAAVWNLFQQAGVGAVGRTWLSKAQTKVDVEDFGAVGDGVTDDSAAIGRAITYLQGLNVASGTINFGRKAYFVGSTITVPANIFLQGESMSGTYLFCNNNNILLLNFTGSYSGASDMFIGGVGAQTTQIPTINPTTINGNSHAILISATAVNVILRRLTVAGGFNCINNQGVDCIFTDIFTQFAYGTAPIYHLNAIAVWMRRVKDDSVWPQGQPTAGQSHSGWLSGTPYSAGATVVVSGFVLQATVGGTSGTVAPTLKPYLQNIVDNTVTWQLAAANNNNAMIFDTGCSENHVFQADFSGAYIAGGIKMLAGSKATYIADSVVSQQFGPGIYGIGGSELVVTRNRIFTGLDANTPGVAMQTAFTGNGSLTQNVIIGSGASSSVGVYVGSGTRNVVSDNIFAGVTTCAQFDNSVTDFNVADNDFGGAATGVLITGASSDWFNVIGNNVHGCTTPVNNSSTGTNIVIAHAGAVTAATIYGGSLAGSVLLLQSTSSGSPSGDRVDIKAGAAVVARLTNAGMGLSPASQGPTGPLGGVTQTIFNNSGNGQLACYFDNVAGAKGLLVNQISSGGPVQINNQANGYLALLANNGVASIYLQPSGGVSVNVNADPGAGAIYINSASFLLRSKTTLNNGAGSSTGTLTNAPAATNPTKWIAIDDNGVTRQIPAW